MNKGTGTDKPAENEKEKTHYTFKRMMYHLGLGLGGVVLGAYFLGGVLLGTINPKQIIKEIKSYNERISIKKEDEKAHLDEVNYEYGRMFENAKIPEDSLEIYKKYNLPFRFLEPSLEQKEKAIKKNQLERSVK